MALPAFVIAVNYAAWFIFMFISVVWILVMLSHRGVADRVRKLGRLPVVSVLIPAYNEGKTIRKSIGSVLSLDYPKDLLDVIVINDCSTDRTMEMAEPFAMQGRVRLLNNPMNRGKAYCLNRALKICRGEFVACVDADSIVEKGIIRKLLPYFHDGGVGAVSPALKVWKKQNYLEKVQHAEYILNVFLRKMLSFLDSIHVTPGVFSMYRLSVLEEVGGFDEGNLTEDMEIALRIHDAGYSIESNLNAVSYTMCPSRWRELYSQRLRWYRGGISNMIKYRHMMFNPAYGNLGVFFLPMNFIAVLSIIIIFLSTVYSYLSMMIDMIWKFHLIGFDLLSMMGGMNLQMLLEGMLSTPVLFGVVGIALGGYVLWLSFMSVGARVRGNTKGYLMYLALFPFVMMVFWFAAIFHEVAGARKKW
jgi:cellulose synthase/poly-beta-1,6-N-acetylglucosamine synthase-like glycosyltransferase